MMEAGNVLCMVAIVYGYGESACILISALVQAVMKNEHEQVFLLMIEEDGTQHPVLCSEGALRVWG